MRPANPSSALLLLSLLLALGCGGEGRETTSREAPSEDAGAIATPDAAPRISGSVTIEPTRPEPSADEDPGLAIVREYTQEFYAGDLERLHDRFTDEFKAEFPIEKLRELHGFVVDTLGRETHVVGEDSKANEEYRAFVRWARFSDFDEVIQIQWILRDDDSIAGLMIQPARDPRGGSGS